MTYMRPSALGDVEPALHLPRWAAPRAESPDYNASAAGAALAVLDAAMRAPEGVSVHRLLANTLALCAAERLSRIEGRCATSEAIRDAYYLTPAGSDHGPDAALLAFWRQFARVPMRGSKWVESAESALNRPDFPIQTWLQSAHEQIREAGPLPMVRHVFRTVLSEDPQAEKEACALADLLLAKALGWTAPLPVLALTLTPSRLRDLHTAATPASFHSATWGNAEVILHTMRQVSVASRRLQAVAGKLRTKGAADAVDLFLNEPVVAPSTMLSPRVQGTRTPMTGRAARRLCARLVELGVAKEKTGRDTFRLYGL